MTSYGKGNPLESVASNGEFVLLYPGADEPDRQRPARADPGRDRGLGRARRRPPQAGPRRPCATILADAGLFSATAQRVELACTVGCELQGLDEVLVAPVVPRRLDRGEDRAGPAARADGCVLAKPAGKRGIHGSRLRPCTEGVATPRA